MKKKPWLLSFCLTGFLLLGVSVGAAEAKSNITEAWLMMGFEVGYSWDMTNQSEFFEVGHVVSPGFSAGVYSFKQGSSIGLFLSASVLFPTEYVLKEQTSPLNSYHDPFNQGILIFGYAFRFPLSKSVNIHLGLGLSGLYSTLSRSLENEVSLRFGIGGELGVKLDLSDVFFLSLGSRGIWNFGESVLQGAPELISIARLHPYISIGTNHFFGFGKPPE